MSDFTDAVDRGLKGLKAVSVGVNGRCAECADLYGYEGNRVFDFPRAVDSGEVVDEPHFSWADCGVCGSALGGDRYFWHALDAETNELLHFDDMCTDCALYVANGDEPEEWSAR